MAEFEILAPAGNLDTLICAINNGADAVYIGGQNFSARKNAVNFTNEEIHKAVEYAHLFGAKVFVTVNTLVYDCEFTELIDYIAFLYSAGVDALIIQDLGVLSVIKEHFPDFELHASTQMTVHNIAGAKIAKKLGFKRVVLSRELTFEEIKNISESVDIELEVFAHGALCMSYSGQCLMSSFIGARSGNRGDCAQPCRLPYTLMTSDGKAVSEKDRYLLSLKDLCLVEKMDELKKCGVKSLKIEGRMKSAEYVSVVTSIYDKYRHGGEVEKSDLLSLENIFSRSGFTRGYLEGNTGRHMLNYEKNNDDVYKNISSDIKHLADSLKKKKTHAPVVFDAQVKIMLDKPIELIVTALSRTVSVKGSVDAQKALNVPLTKERISEQIGKTGSTPFALGSIEIDMEEGISLPVKEINAVRRDALSLLQAEITKTDREPVSVNFKTKAKALKAEDKVSFNAQVKTLKQMYCAIDAGFNRVLVPYSLYVKNKVEIDAISHDICVVLPVVTRDNVPIDIHSIKRDVYASNISHLDCDLQGRIYADYTLNAFNSYTTDVLKSFGVDRVCLSPELNLRDVSSVSSEMEKEIIVYGRLPLMTVQNCIVKSSLDSCGCKTGYYLLKDRKGMLFPVFTDKGVCTNTIHNSLPIYMADKLDLVEKSGVSNMRFVFTTEKEDEIYRIYHMYQNAIKPDFEFTRGHYFRERMT